MYTLLGFAIGFVLASVYYQCNKEKCDRPWAIGESLVMFTLVVIPTAIGFGYGAGLLFSGNHYLNK